MVPNGWKLTSLGEVCSGKLQTGPFGSQLHAHEYTDEGVPVLMPKDLINFRANHDSAAKIPVHRSEDLKKHILKSGDILFSRRGDVARFALIESDLPTSLCGTGCLKATPNKAHSSLFLSYFLQKNAVKKWLEQNAVGQTMPNMNTAILAELPLMVASCRGEEDKIAQILSTWDRGIATTEKLIASSKQQKKALMQQLLTGKKRLFNPETGKAFEGEWEYKCLSRLTTIITNGFVGTATPYYTDESGVPYLYGLNVKNNKLNRKGLRYVTSEFHAKQTKSQLSEGDLLMVQSGHIGETAVVTKEFENSNCHALIVIKPKRNFVYPAFLSCYFNSEHGKYRLNCLEVGSTIMHINTKDMKKFVVPLPSLLEQQKIASVLTAADKEIGLLDAKLTHLKQEKKALMQQLLTGKRRVKVDKNTENAI